MNVVLQILGSVILGVGSMFGIERLGFIGQAVAAGILTAAAVFVVSTAGWIALLKVIGFGLLGGVAFWGIKYLGYDVLYQKVLKAA